ncbi:Sucrose porin precursor [Providencia rustigianii]|nr:Sucrose porin precursor [Providencia rustigianii]
MKKFYLSAIAVGFAAISPTHSQAETDLSKIEARLQALEKRAEQAEQRANVAERKAEKLEQIMMANSSPALPPTQQVALSNSEPPALVNTPSKNAPGIQYNHEYGELKLYGDVEFNLDSASRKGQITSVRTALGKDKEPNKSDNWDINGRILIGLDGKRINENGNYARFLCTAIGGYDGKNESG